MCRRRIAGNNSGPAYCLLPCSQIYFSFFLRIVTLPSNMRRVSILIFSTFCLLVKHNISFSQGCSDAGVCSVGSLSIIGFRYVNLPADENVLSKMDVYDPALIIKTGSGIDSIRSVQKTELIPPVKKEKDTLQTGKIADTAQAKTPSSSLLYYTKYPKYSFNYSAYYGAGDRGTTIFTHQMDVNVRLIKKKLFGQIKLPYTLINGNLARVNGMSDVTLSLSYSALSRRNSNLTITAGAKIPVNNANLFNDTLPLPMVYQTSLGTTDLLTGAKFTYKKWEATVGYQHAFNANENEYLHSAVIANDAEQNKYFESNKLKRADDAVFRMNRNFSYKRCTATAGLLFIYHLKDDVITNSAGQRAEAIGSQGLTLNLNMATAIPIYKNLDFTFMYARPFVTRQSRPDGLGRYQVIIAGFRLNIY